MFTWCCTPVVLPNHPLHRFLPSYICVAYSRTFYEWDCTTCTHMHCASFMQYHVFEVHPCPCCTILLHSTFEIEVKFTQRISPLKTSKSVVLLHPQCCADITRVSLQNTFISLKRHLPTNSLSLFPFPLILVPGNYSSTVYLCGFVCSA